MPDPGISMTKVETILLQPPVMPKKTEFKATNRFAGWLRHAPLFMPHTGSHCLG